MRLATNPSVLNSLRLSQIVARLLCRSGMLLLTLILSMSATQTVHAQTVTILHSFGDGSDGRSTTDAHYPESGLVQDSDGNLYGTTSLGGATVNQYSFGNGTVYKVSPSGALTILHDFSTVSSTVPYGNQDGSYPLGGVTQGRDGEFYGTTASGGANGTGTIFKITSDGVLTTLYDFSAVNSNDVNRDGAHPFAGLVQGRDGNFYGTTTQGGLAGAGTVFKITPLGTLTPLHSFQDGSVIHDGKIPYAPLIQGTDGNFYGTTKEGGAPEINRMPGYDAGTIFKIMPDGTEIVLHRFNDGSVSHDGQHPIAALVQGNDGNFYGTTYEGGSAKLGTVYKMTPSGTVIILHSFDDGSTPNDGQEPVSSLIQGSDGNFYGTTDSGGNAAEDVGTIVRITPDGKETILHRFNDGTVPFDGQFPQSALIQGIDGNYYGTTSEGGTRRAYGTVFALNMKELVPAPVINSFAPASGSAGSSAIIIGQNFQWVNTIRFHDANAVSFYVNIDGTQLRLIVPQGAQKGTVTVTSPGGSATTVEPFRVTYAPVITSFAPTSGPVGTVVTIMGTHLDGITRVRFHNADATVYSSNPDGTQLTVTVPPGAATGTITLDNRDVLKTTSTGTFTVTP